ncbi:antirepressor, partial [Enterococcus faecium]
LEENNIQKIDLAVLYGMPKQDIGNYLEGKLVDTPKAKQLLVKIISDFKIR